VALVGVLVACGQAGALHEEHPDWVIRSKVVFVSPDLSTPRQPMTLDTFRLSFPYIAGDLYGSPTTGDFIKPTLNADYTFEMDLNRTQEDLLHSLEPTEFSLDYLRVEPREARIARLAPLALQPDGIERIASADWVNPASDEPLMLVYVDRPARITGALTRNGHTIRYNVRAGTAGYIWIGRRQTEDGEQMYTEVPRPDSVVLALSPPQGATQSATPPPITDAPPGELPANDLRPAALPAHTGIPDR
jgi:hypothetical protein